MNNARMALQLAGMVFILVGVAVLYYQTDLKNEIPEGVAIATLLVLAGLFVIAFSEQVRRSRRDTTVVHERPAVTKSTYVHDTQAVEGRTLDRPRAGRRRVREERVEESIEHR